MTGLWVIFFSFVGILLVLDLGVFNRRSHELGFKRALKWTGFWVAIALAFNVFVGLAYHHQWFGAGTPTADAPLGLSGTDAFIQFLTGYLLEESLSFDNLFVIALIIGAFKIPARDQHRVLFWGILGAIISRGLFVALGVLLVRKFAWIFYVFGALLLVTAFKMLFGKEGEADPTKTWYYRAIRRILPITESEHPGRMLVRENGRLVFTRLVPAILVIELTDVMFAIDSVPAIFGVTSDPFIVFSSNIFAILGLRSLYFVLASSLSRFHHLKTAVTCILIFIGTKMLLHDVLHDVPAKLMIGLSLGFVGIALFLGIWLSIRSPKQSTP